jgi:hypothetical protein
MQTILSGAQFLLNCSVLVVVVIYLTVLCCLVAAVDMRAKVAETMTSYVDNILIEYANNVR